MAASKSLEDIYYMMIFEKKEAITYDVYSKHLGDMNTVASVENRIVMGFFLDINGVAVDATYLSLNTTPSVGCRRELEDSEALLSYYPQSSTLSLTYSDAQLAVSGKTDFTTLSIYSDLERWILFPLLISATVFLLLFTLLRAILRRTPIAYRLHLRHVTGR